KIQSELFRQTDQERIAPHPIRNRRYFVTGKIIFIYSVLSKPVVVVRSTRLYTYGLYPPILGRIEYIGPYRGFYSPLSHFSGICIIFGSIFPELSDDAVFHIVMIERQVGNKPPSSRFQTRADFIVCTRFGF